MPNIAYPYDYARIMATIAAHVPQWRHAGFDAVVAIARGGLPAGAQIACELSLPLFAVGYDRASRQAGWFTRQQPAPGMRVLLVEDIAGRGHTLADCLAFVQAEGCQPHTFALAYDAASRIVPDDGLRIPDGHRAWFPWERESITPAFDATANLPDAPLHAYAAWAIDLDGILVDDIPAEDYARDLDDTLARRDRLPLAGSLPPLPNLPGLTIITGRPEQDRARTLVWLREQGFSGNVIMRDAQQHTAAQTAVHKAQALLAGRFTHFLESEAAQAVEIARLAPVAQVYWWRDGQAVQVHACQTVLA